jgi:hypothetical protein
MGCTFPKSAGNRRNFDFLVEKTKTGKRRRKFHRFFDFWPIWGPFWVPEIGRKSEKKRCQKKKVEKKTEISANNFTRGRGSAVSGRSPGR